MAITLPHDAMAQMFDAMASNDLPDVPNYNVCPTNALHVVTSADENRRLMPMRWGFIPKWYKSPTDGPLIINARSETIADKPAFRTACRSQRCLVVASGFYEWKREAGQKPQPRYITRTDEEPMVFGGIWQDWEGDGQRLTTCAIVTCPANADMEPIHHRLPVILDPVDWALWLGEQGKGAARLMTPAAIGVLRFTQVSTAVNSNKASGAALIAPLA